MEAAYEIEIPTFTGPLDLLLQLIEKHELDITAVSLATVADQYLAQVAEMSGSRLEHLIDFLVIAARLALIKSRALLPQSATPDDEEEEDDPADALLRQLRRYGKFKQAAYWLGERSELGLRTYLRVAAPPRRSRTLELDELTVDALVAALEGVLARADRKLDSVSVARPRQLTIEDQISRLRRLSASEKSFGFRDLLSTRASALEVAVSLLAILELIKRREIVARQEALFGPITIMVLEPGADAGAASSGPAA